MIWARKNPEGVILTRRHIIGKYEEGQIVKSLTDDIEIAHIMILRVWSAFQTVLKAV